MKILILEDSDERQRTFRGNLIGHSVEIHATATAVISRLQAEKWDWLFLDHDLGGKTMVPSGPGTGYEVACWLEQHPDRMPWQIVIHSFNNTGAARMKATLPQAHVIPGVWTCSTLAEDLTATTDELRRKEARLAAPLLDT